MDYKAKLIKNEQIIRNRNKGAVNAIKQYFYGRKNLAGSELELTCECSDPSCGKRIKITISEYEKIHRRNDRFIILKGHQSPAVEKIVASKSNFTTVEKPQLAAD
jgi:hypothetical protein